MTHLPPRNQAIGRNTQNSQTSIILIPYFSSGFHQPSSRLNCFSLNLTALSQELKFAEWLIFLSVTLLLQWDFDWWVLGIFSHVGDKVLQENLRGQKWERHVKDVFLTHQAPGKNRDDQFLWIKSMASLECLRSWEEAFDSFAAGLGIWEQTSSKSLI